MQKVDSKAWKTTLVMVVAVLVLCVGVLWYALQQIRVDDPQSYAHTTTLTIEDSGSYDSLQDYILN